MTPRRVREAPPGATNVVDSSAWIAYFENEPSAAAFAPAVEALERLAVPTICLLEVFKAYRRLRSEDDTRRAIALMRRGYVVPLDGALALDAARLGAAHQLATADGIVYATARLFGATLWTQDAHFQGPADVRSVPKHSA